METIRQYIYNRGAGRGRYPKAQADKLADGYNAFAKAEAERAGRLLGEEVKVESVNDGSFHLYFPVIKSPEVRLATRAMDWMSPRKKSKTPARLLLGHSRIGSRLKFEACVWVGSWL
jgi:hypothetical protein